MSAQQLSLEAAFSRRDGPETVEFTPIPSAENDARFWSKVEFNDRGCWLWKAHTGSGGYGAFWVAELGSHVPAHRWSFLRYGGQLTGERRYVLHNCDTPPCVRPSHLRAGSGAENMAERNAKGRQARLAGEANGLSKLTEADVREIRRLRDSGVLLKELALRFGISIAVAHNVGRRRTWTHVPEESSAR